MQVPVARPMLGEEEIAAVADVLRSGMLAQGKVTAAFEEAFAEYCGAAHAVAVNSGTAALHAVLLASGIGPGDSVIVPSFSFIATATCVSMCGATPLFADVDPRTFNIDPVSAEGLIRGDTKAIIGVHLYGQPFDAPALQEISTERGLLLVEDAAQAHGAALSGRKAGTLGDAGCFSFYPTKNMTTGEGGMVTTDDSALAEKVRLLINHGQSRKYLHTVVGYNYRMTDIGAAIGLVQFAKLEQFNERRIHNAMLYNRLLEDSSLTLPCCREGARHVYHQYAVQVQSEFPVSRDGLMQFLAENGIGTAVHYPIPIHRQPVYEAMARGCSCPISEMLSGTAMSLPVHPQVSDEEIFSICDLIRSIE